MTVLDASVLIAHLDDDDSSHARAEALLDSLADLPLSASVLTLGEVLVGPARVGKLALAMAALARMGVDAVSLDEQAPARLAGLRAETGLRMPDCSVLFAAQQLDRAVATFDAGLRSAAGRIGIEIRDG